MSRTVCNLMLAIALLSGAAACGTAGPAAGQRLTSVQPLYGTPAASLQLTAAADVLQLAIANPGADGAFAQLDLPAGMSLEEATWTGLGPSDYPEALAVVLPNAAGLEVGCVPLPGRAPERIELRVRLASGPRTASIAPSGAGNVITDLTVVDVGGGQVGLGWTQTNAGDYDFNGEVNASDLVGIARNYLQTYSTANPTKHSLPLYWVDGDYNGEINLADITVISQHYLSSVGGYNVRHDGSLLPGASPGAPTLEVAAALPQINLPPRFQLVTPGAVGDSWLVTAVDPAGSPGTDSAGSTGSVDLVTAVSIDGVDLFDLSGANPGGIDQGKVSSRVILPIEDVAGAYINKPVVSVGLTNTFTQLPKGRTLLLQFTYLPSVSLITGQPKGAASARHGSAMAEDYVNTSIPFTLPDVPGSAAVDADIDLLANPSGGYFVQLTATITPPGGAPVTSTTRLDYAAGRLNRDSDNDGVFEDELTFTDDDKDCVSNSLLQNGLADDEYGNGRNEARMVATVAGLDLAAGTLSLTEITLFEGDLEQPVEPLMLRFNESTEYEDGLLPQNIEAGSRLEVHFYRLSDAAGVLPDIYWAESFGKEGPEDFAFLEASDDREGEIRVKWGRPAGYEKFILKRYSPRQPDGNYELDWELLFEATAEPTYEDAQLTAGVLYHYVYYGKTPADDIIELGTDSGLAEPPD